MSLGTQPLVLNPAGLSWNLIFSSCQSWGQDALQVKLESLVSSQGSLAPLAPHLRLREVGSRDLLALAKTAQLVGHSRPVSHRNGWDVAGPVGGSNFIHFLKWKISDIMIQQSSGSPILMVDTWKHTLW